MNKLPVIYNGSVLGFSAGYEENENEYILDVDGISRFYNKYDYELTVNPILPAVILADNLHFV